MPRYEVAVATRNPKVRYLAVNLLKRLGIGFVLCAPDDRRCGMSQVIITTESEASQFQANHLVVVDETLNDDATSIEVMIGLFDVRNPLVIAIGIDPGMKFGLALTADGTAIYTTTASTPFAAANHTIHWITIVQQHFQNSILVRVGTGSRLYSALYLRGMKDSNTQTIQIEMVDERHTTRVGESDKSSAALIASRKGRRVADEDLYLEVKEGYVKSLKRLVKKVTEGRLSLTSAQAFSVLQNEMLLEEILSEFD
ncbi:MAG: hypothetical protein ACW98J_03565 [Candidatus Thorarchaeota archaeon]|jgi:hypothetical protein